MQSHIQKPASPQSTTTTQAKSINDSSANSMTLQRHAILTSSVIQCANPSDKKFKYFPNISDNYKDRVPYEPGFICFTKYNGGLIKSAGFNGCFMMAFKFQNGFISLLENPTSIALNATYIAHVANGIGDTKEALFDAENRGLITIEAIFRPYRNSAMDYPRSTTISDGNKVASVLPGTPYRQAGMDKLTGGLEKTENGWESHVFTQEKIYPNEQNHDFIWKNEFIPYRTRRAGGMQQETLATKAYIYAWEATNGASNQRDSARRKLIDIIESGPLGKMAVNYAFVTITVQDEPARELLLELKEQYNF